MTRDPGNTHEAAVDGSAARRTLLVGTATAVAQLDQALAALEQAPNVIGCVLPDTPVLPGDFHMPVLGEFDSLEQTIDQHEVDDILLSLPAAMVDEGRQLAKRLDAVAADWRFLPMLADQLVGRTPDLARRAASTSTIQFADIGAVDTVHLIGRHAHPLDEQAIRSTIEGRAVLISGAGGSIGSELARIVCRFNPSRIVLMERGENALFEIDRQIARLYPHVDRAAMLHDVTNASRTMAVLTAHKPAVVFHAAAHKHVPMMEQHPSDAVENNFYGTRAIADAAAANGVDRFVMISTDKAVNPSSVMGATKRLAELYIQWLNGRSDTLFSMVRFGNVLGSACSVLPIWSQQLSHGGPITVTHPDMTRYFMTIPEAAGLVIQSAAYAGGTSEQPTGGGEVFLLDMGQPVHILDLAKRFVRSFGLEPNVDIPITITGVRPGEKLFEELAYDGEDMLPTPHQSIRIWRTQPPNAAAMQRIIETFDRLREKASGDHTHRWSGAAPEAILAALRTAVPEMVQSAAG